MNKLPNEEEFGPFGEAAVSLLGMLFPEVYKKVLIVNPTFCEVNQANINPQFEHGDYIVLSAAEVPKQKGRFSSEIRLLQVSTDIEELLDVYRYQHAIFATNDLSVLTIWAQAEYAIIAFKNDLLREHEEWLNNMQEFGFTRQL